MRDVTIIGRERFLAPGHEGDQNEDVFLVSVAKETMNVGQNVLMGKD